MDHSIAIESLKEDLEQAKTEVTYLAAGIAAMMLRETAGSDRIRQDTIQRRKRKLDTQQEKVRSLKATIKYLEQHTTERKK